MTIKEISQSININPDDVLGPIYLAISYKTVYSAIIAGLLGSLTSFISSYVWDSPSAIYSLISLMAFDWALSIYLAVKSSWLLRYQAQDLTPKKRVELRKKRFSIIKFISIVGSVIVAFWLMGISWNISRANPLFYFLPGFVYGGFAGAYLVSTFKNLVDIGFFSPDILNEVKRRLKIK